MMLKTFVFLCVIFNAFSGDPSKNDYCSKNCKNEKHTACKCTLEGPRELVDDDIVKFRQGIIDYHNEQRNLVAKGGTKLPGAANMMAVSYDLELEYLARCYAKRFAGGHDKCRLYFDGRYAGQNLAGMSARSDDMVKMQRMWYNEIENTEASDVAKFSRTTGSNGKVLGHFTQFAWAKVDRIGCARVWTPNQKTAAYRMALICNYGNVNGSTSNLSDGEVYKAGKQCSDCPFNTKCEESKYPALCGKILPVPTDPPSAASANSCIRVVFLVGIGIAVFLLY